MEDVTRDLSLFLVSQNGTESPIDASAVYSKEDPFAVRLVFHQPNLSTPEVRWVFSRDLLMWGLNSKIGEADVKVEPVESDKVEINFSSPDGEACLHVSKLDLAEFLQASDKVVQFGHESEFFAKKIDETVARIITTEQP